jgi:hypothetical protein
MENLHVDYRHWVKLRDLGLVGRMTQMAVDFEPAGNVCPLISLLAEDERNWWRFDSSLILWVDRMPLEGNAEQVAPILRTFYHFHPHWAGLQLSDDAVRRLMAFCDERAAWADLGGLAYLDSRLAQILGRRAADGEVEPQFVHEALTCWLQLPSCPEEYRRAMAQLVAEIEGGSAIGAGTETSLSGNDFF